MSTFVELIESGIYTYKGMCIFKYLHNIKDYNTIRKVLKIHKTIKKDHIVTFVKDLLMDDIMIYEKGNIIKDLMIHYPNTIVLMVEIGYIPITFDEYIVFISACIHGYYDIVKKINEKYTGYMDHLEALTYACQFEYVDIVKLLLADSRVNLNESYCEQIIEVCTNGNLEIFNLLYNRDDCDPSIPDNTPTEYSVTYGHFEIFKILINDKRVLEYVDKKYLMYLACSKNHLNIVKYLYNKFPNEKLFTGVDLGMSVKNNNIETIKYLLSFDHIYYDFNEYYPVTKHVLNKKYYKLLYILLNDDRTILSDMVKNHKELYRYACNESHTYNNKFGTENNKAIKRKGFMDLIIIVK